MRSRLCVSPWGHTEASKHPWGRYINNILFKHDGSTWIKVPMWLYTQGNYCVILKPKQLYSIERFWRAQSQIRRDAEAYEWLWHRQQRGLCSNRDRIHAHQPLSSSLFFKLRLSLRQVQSEKDKLIQENGLLLKELKKKVNDEGNEVSCHVSMILIIHTYGKDLYVWMFILGDHGEKHAFRSDPKRISWYDIDTAIRQWRPET